MRRCTEHGQKRDFGWPTFSHFVSKGIESLTHADLRLWKTSWFLRSKIRFLTKDFFEERRVRYLLRFQRYIVLSVVFFGVMALISNGALATSEPPVEEIEVQSGFLTARDVQTVGQLLAAEKIFEDLQGRSPKAELRFKVFGRKNANQWKDVGLELMTRDGRVPVTLDQDGRFAIDDAWRSLDPDAKLRSRLRDGRVTWRADIRSPGSTTRTRRLGDLRLQCEASFWSGVARGTTGSFKAMNRMLRSTLNGCDSKWFGWSAFADEPVFGIRFVHGDKAMHVPLRQIGGLGDPSFPGYDWAYALRESMYRLYLGDNRWPDDTIVEFQYIDDPIVPSEPDLLASSNRLATAARLLRPGATTLKEVNKQLGSSQGTLRYNDGRSAVLYRLTGRERLELVTFFDSEDRLVKYELRMTDVQKLKSSVPVPW